MLFRVRAGGTRHYNLARELIRSGMMSCNASASNHASGQADDCTHGKLSTFASLVRFLSATTRTRLSRQHGPMWNMFVSHRSVVRPRRPEMRKPDVYRFILTLLAAFAAERLARRYVYLPVLEIRDLCRRHSLIWVCDHSIPQSLGSNRRRYLYRNADKIITLLPRFGIYLSPKERGRRHYLDPNGVDME